MTRRPAIFVGLPYSTQGALLDAAQAAGVPVLISAGSLHRQRRRPLPDGSRPWAFTKLGDAIYRNNRGAALDSAGFSAMRQGGYRWTVAEYVEFVATNNGDGAMPFPWLWWAAMDYCCEPEIAGDRAEVLDRIRRTVESLEEHLEEVDYWRGEGAHLPDPMPVLQGRRPEDYERCAAELEWVLRAAGRDGLPDLVGVGSVCRRELEGPEGLREVLEALDRALPPRVRLHLFGVKGDALPELMSALGERIASVDSMAWDFRARKEARAAGEANTVEGRASALVAWHAAQVARLEALDNDTDNDPEHTDADTHDDDDTRRARCRTPSGALEQRERLVHGHDQPSGVRRRADPAVGSHPCGRAGGGSPGPGRTPHAVITCQRWRAGAERWVFDDGDRLDPGRYDVRLLRSDRLARAFVCCTHYSGSYPAARCRVGLYAGRALVGVAVFSVPMSSAALLKHCGTVDAVELGRFVLLDEVPGNAETWFLARAFEALVADKPQIRAVLSYSDPIRRVALDGSTVLPGHVGTIYQAHNGRHVGRGKAARHVLDPFGRVVSPRALSKIRNGHRGSEYAARALLAAGAPAPRPGEDPRSWVARALEEGPFRTLRHPGNLAYVWAVGDRRARRTTERGFPAPLDYPKQRALGLAA